MKYILILALALGLLPACQSGTPNRELKQKLADLEFRVSWLEKQLAEQHPADSLQSGSYGTSAGLQSGDRYNGSTQSYYSARCQAPTKEGTQCKRSAQSGGYCWQHGG